MEKKTIISKEELKGYEEFRKELTTLINIHSLENESDTPDFILAYYLTECLQNFNRAVKLRTSWQNPTQPL